MSQAYIIDAVRTPFGRYGGGGLAGVHADDLAAVPMAALMARHPHLNSAALDDVLYGCAKPSRG